METQTKDELQIFSTKKLETEKKIEWIKTHFKNALSVTLNLYKISAPIAVLSGKGINDDLNGVEKPVSFKISDMLNLEAEIVQSLAKWKRIRLKDLEIPKGYGIVADMRALRPDEKLSPIHSLYVDQWDWEQHISKAERSLAFLKDTVRKIYEAIKLTEKELSYFYPEYPELLPEDITFIHSEELQKQYPYLSPKEREQKSAKEYGAIFIIGIGNKLEDGVPHDFRAPDYDDWSTETVDEHTGLNGDIIFWNPVLQQAFEISSMGIRVDHKALVRQLRILECDYRKDLFFHKLLLTEKLTPSIGGGIGQSRLCMFFLRKKHIGEVQVGIWPDELYTKSSEKKIELL